MDTTETTEELTSAVTVIGIDAATDPKNVGLARGVFGEGGLRLLDVLPRVSKSAELIERIVAWAQPPTLLAIDAPLGWPRALGLQLLKHRAGEALGFGANDLFRRCTDRDVYLMHGLTPLDVGADRIARTAHAALVLLAALRDRLGRQIPLVWSPRFAGFGAIEVYPAATLVARGQSRLNYKKEALQRRVLIEALAGELGVGLAAPAVVSMQERDHGFDAALCVLAGADFLAGRARGPEPAQQELAQQEGWIWVRASARGGAASARAPGGPG